MYIIIYTYICYINHHPHQWIHISCRNSPFLPAEIQKKIAPPGYSAGGQTRLVHLHEDLLRRAGVVAHQVTSIAGMKNHGLLDGKVTSGGGKNRNPLVIANNVSVLLWARADMLTFYSYRRHVIISSHDFGNSFLWAHHASWLLHGCTPS